MSIRVESGSGIGFCEEKEPSSPLERKTKGKELPNSLISTIDSSTEIVGPNRGTVKVELNCDDENRTKIVFPMGPFKMTARAWPGEDYAAQGFILKEDCWQFPDSSIAAPLDPQPTSPKTSPPKHQHAAPTQAKNSNEGAVSKFFKFFKT